MRTEHILDDLLAASLRREAVVLDADQVGQIASFLGHLRDQDNDGYVSSTSWQAALKKADQDAGR